MGENTDRFKRLGSKGEVIVGNDSNDRMPAIRPGETIALVLDTMRTLTRKLDVLSQLVTQLDGRLESMGESRARDREDYRKDIDKLETRAKDLEEHAAKQDVQFTELKTKFGIYVVIASALISTAVGILSHVIK